MKKEKILLNYIINDEMELIITTETIYFRQKTGELGTLEKLIDILYIENLRYSFDNLIIDILDQNEKILKEFSVFEIMHEIIN